MNFTLNTSADILNLTSPIVVIGKPDLVALDALKRIAHGFKLTGKAVGFGTFGFTHALAAFNCSQERTMVIVNDGGEDGALECSRDWDVILWNLENAIELLGHNRWTLTADLSGTIQVVTD